MATKTVGENTLLVRPDLSPSTNASVVWSGTRDRQGACFSLVQRRASGPLRTDRATPARLDRQLRRIADSLTLHPSLLNRQISN